MSTALYTPIEGRQGCATGLGLALLDGDLNGLFGDADAQTAYLMKLLVEQTRVPVSLTVPSTGTPRVTGTATLPTRLAEAATGTPRVVGTAAISTRLTATATATPRVSGTATVPMRCTTLSTGTPRVSGTASLPLLRVTAAGTARNLGTALLDLGLRLLGLGGPRNRRVRVVADATGARYRATDDTTGPRVRVTHTGEL